MQIAATLRTLPHMCVSARHTETQTQTQDTDTDTHFAHNTHAARTEQDVTHTCTHTCRGHTTHATKTKHVERTTAKTKHTAKQSTRGAHHSQSARGLSDRARVLKNVLDGHADFVSVAEHHVIHQIAAEAEGLLARRLHRHAIRKCVHLPGPQRPQKRPPQRPKRDRHRDPKRDRNRDPKRDRHRDPKRDRHRDPKRDRNRDPTIKTKPGQKRPSARCKERPTTRPSSPLTKRGIMISCHAVA